MSFYIQLYWNPADEPPFGYREYTSKPYPTKRKAWEYVQRVMQRAKLSDAQLHDVAVFAGKPRGIDVDHEHQRIHDHALWRMSGRKTSYRAMFY